MLIYKNTFDNIKTSNFEFPIEDQFYATETEAIVADGITRDPIGVSDLSVCSNEEFLEKYPKPSGAELAAKTICDTFSKTNGSLMEKLIKCNESVRKLNNKYKYGVLNYVLNSKSDYDLDFICLLDGIANDYIINNFEKKGIEVIIYGTIKIKKDVKYIVDDYKL